MATIWPTAAGAEPLELRAGGHRRGRPAGLRGGLAAPGPAGAAHRRPIAPEAIPAALLEGLATSLRAWLDEGGFTPAERGGDRPAPRPAGKRLRRDCQPGAAAGSLPRCRPGICGIRRSLCARNSA
ncbi:hypothetical protein LNP17_20855 [Klebsiella variicola subsp. variicola]|nr:hypothetical protein [Klebsiella variicola subsp. variicola]